MDRPARRCCCAPARERCLSRRKRRSSWCRKPDNSPLCRNRSASQIVRREEQSEESSVSSNPLLQSLFRTSLWPVLASTKLVAVRCATGTRSGPRLEPELQPLRDHEVVLWHSADGAGILQLIDADIEHVLDPIIGIPVDSGGVLDGVVIKRRHETGRVIVQEVGARLLRLNAGESEG